MTPPRIELIPLKSAVCSDAPIALDVLVRITPPPPEVHFPRPPLNLALVLDRSGSMAGADKMPYAREAAAFAVRQLLPTDRVSVTIFDNEVETILPNAPAADKPSIVRQIEGIEPRGSTALHGGWAEGGRQAEGNRIEGGLNRVLLLSDGLANVGVTDPNTIATEAKGLAARGVGTTTLGVGSDYNEDLMEAMARAGDGNYYYVKSPVQLTDIFQTELQGLMATVGQKVSLGVEPESPAKIAEVLNDFERAPTGRMMLSNLLVGMPILVLVRLSVPPRPKPGPLCGFRLAWDDPAGGPRRVLRADLGNLPAVSHAEWSALPDDPAAREQAALLMAARAQKEAAAALARGDHAGTVAALSQSRMYASACPPSPATEDELEAIGDIEAALAAGDLMTSSKLAKYRSYLRKTSRSKPPDPTSK